MKKWRILYDGLEPCDLGVARYTVLLDPVQIHKYVERALKNKRHLVELGNGLLQVRIEGRKHGSLREVREKTDARAGVLRQMRNKLDGREAGAGSGRSKANKGGRSKWK